MGAGGAEPRFSTRSTSGSKFCANSPAPFIFKYSLLKRVIYLMYIRVSPAACLYEGVTSPGIGVIDNCKLLRGCWEIEPGSFGRAASALNCEPSLQPLF